jgi:hypothetical protein
MELAKHQLILTLHDQKMATPVGWLYRAILSAVFAAFIAIFAEAGIQGINSDHSAKCIVLLRFTPPK